MNILFFEFKKQGYASRQVLEYKRGGYDANIELWESFSIHGSDSTGR